MPYIEIPATSVNLKIIGGRNIEEVSYQYQDVFDDFDNARKIRIATYNLKTFRNNREGDGLFQRLCHIDNRVDKKIIIGVPGLYRSTVEQDDWGEQLKITLEDIQQYFGKDEVRINVKNHAKFIGTERKLYLGSQNLTWASRFNYETGVIIEDTNIVNEFYNQIFSQIWEESISVHGDIYMIRQQVIDQFTLDNF